jgi:elongation factor P
MPAVIATNLRKGVAIKVNGETGMIIDFEHRTPGKGAGFVQVIMRSFGSGKSKDMRFAASEKVETIQVDKQKLEFSYTDGTNYFFMDSQTFETIELPVHLLEESKDMLIENLPCEVVFVEDNPVSVELPPSVELEITESSEGIKGDTANNPQKPATLETGKVIQVPLFVKQGDRIKVDTRTGKYLGRV